jgi:hypothetical protein
VNKGLEILLARMDSHPQDFNILELNSYGPRDMWGVLVSIVRDEDRSGGFITPEERKGFEVKMHKVKGELFTRAVIARVMHHDSSSKQEPTKQMV